MFLHCIKMTGTLFHTLVLRWVAVLFIVLALVWLGACQKTPAVPSPEALRWAESAKPPGAQLAQKYERSCQACHSSRTSAAPLTAFAPDWQVRLQQGMPTLVNHARDGFKGMPARGYCNDCSDQELQALITFMSTPSTQE